MNYGRDLVKLILLSQSIYRIINLMGKLFHFQSCFEQNNVGNCILRINIPIIIMYCFITLALKFTNEWKYI